MQRFQINKIDFKILLGYLGFATLWILFRNYVEAYTLREYLIDIPVFWMQTIVLLYFSKYIIEYIIFKNRNYIIVIVFSIIGFWLIGFMTYLSGEFSRDGFIHWEAIKINLQTVIYNIQNSSVNLALPLALISGKKYYEFQIDKLQYSSSKKELELKLLQSKFSPHFLYNSLNTIDALIDYSSKEKVKAYIINLAKLYRYFINNQEEEVANILDEIALVKNYIFLINTRFENYYFHFNNNQINTNKYLPNGALLSVVENVVKHNKPMNNKQINTQIIFNENEVEIINNLGLPSNNKPLGTGIKNLQKRYSLLSDKNIEIIKTDSSFAIKLPLLNITN